MKTLHEFTALVEREGDGYVALCPEFDVASQGNTVEEARNNLAEAVPLFLETADFDGTYARMQAEGVPFREAHEVAGGCVRRAEARGIEVWIASGRADCNPTCPRVGHPCPNGMAVRPGGAIAGSAPASSVK